MPRETDLLRVKLVAHTLLDVQIQETALPPVIVSHPFTSSGISALRNEDPGYGANPAEVQAESAASPQG